MVCHSTSSCSSSSCLLYSSCSSCSCSCSCSCSSCSCSDSSSSSSSCSSSPPVESSETLLFLFAVATTFIVSCSGMSSRNSPESELGLLVVFLRVLSLRKRSAMGCLECLSPL